MKSRQCTLAMFIIGCSFFLSLSFHTFAEEPLTLSQAIQLSLQQNSQILLSKNSLQSAEIKFSESRSALYPQVILQGLYSYLGPISTYSLTMGPGRTIDMKFGQENTYNAFLSVQHSLFDWGRSHSSVAMSEDGVRLAEATTAIVQSAVTYQVIQFYYGTLMTAEAISVFDQNIASLQERLRITHERFSAGLASNFDLLSIQVQIASLKSKKLEMENLMEKMKINFNMILGRPMNTAVLLADSLVFHPVILDRDSLIAVAMIQRPDLKQLSIQQSLSRKQIEFTRTLDKPNVNATINYGMRNGFYPNPDVLRGNWVASMSVTYPLFDGFRISSQVGQAEIAAQSTEMRSKDLRQSISSEILQTVADLVLNERKIEIEQLRITQAEEALKIAEERHTKGLISTLELLDAQNSLASARLNYLQAVHNYTMSLVAIDKATGKTPS